MEKKFEVGNVVKTPYNSVIILTKFSKHKECGVNGAEYDYVSYDYYGKDKCSGGMRLVGNYEKESCGCWYEKWERCYHQRCPDPYCEDCKGSGEVIKYREGLNDCIFLASNVLEYRKYKIKEKIKILEEELKNLEENVPLV